jgi:hypothetical protein
MSDWGAYSDTSVAAGSAATHCDVQAMMRCGETRDESAWLTSFGSTSACSVAIVSNRHRALAPSSADYFRGVSASVTHRRRIRRLTIVVMPELVDAFLIPGLTRD